MATKEKNTVEASVLKYFEEKKKLSDIALKIIKDLLKLKDEKEKKKVIDDIRSIFEDIFSEYNPDRYIRRDQDDDDEDEDEDDDCDDYDDWEDDDDDQDWEDYEDSGIMYISGNLYAGEKHKILHPLIEYFNSLPYDKENIDIVNFYPIVRDLVFQVNTIIPPEINWRESRISQLLQIINGRFINHDVDICDEDGVAERLINAMRLGGDDYMLSQKYKEKEHDYTFRVRIYDIDNLRVEVIIDYDRFGLCQFSETFQSALLDELNEYINRQD